MQKIRFCQGEVCEESQIQGAYKWFQYDKQHILNAIDGEYSQKKAIQLFINSRISLLNALLEQISFITSKA